ncbi:unannotated protein [freshwater metagenome]|uniref:Unannotated protein n=1 Tax=freshwater metagenome TaxID=449393 RepID=A0A6J7I3A2_9ZZZZ
MGAAPVVVPGPATGRLGGPQPAGVPAGRRAGVSTTSAGSGSRVMDQWSTRRRGESVTTRPRRFLRPLAPIPYRR